MYCSYVTDCLGIYYILYPSHLKNTYYIIIYYRVLFGRYLQGRIGQSENQEFSRWVALKLYDNKKKLFL